MLQLIRKVAASHPTDETAVESPAGPEAGETSPEVARRAAGKTGRRKGGTASSRSLDDAWRRSRPGLAVILLLTLFANILKLAIPLYIFQLLDRVIASKSADTLVMLTVIVATAIVFGALIEYVRRWMMIRWGAWIEDRFGRELFVSSLERYRSRSPGRALADLSEIRQFVASGSATAWLDVVFAPAFVLVVYLIHPLLAGVVVVCMTLTLLLGFLNEIVTRQSRSTARSAKTQSRNWMEAAEQNLETVATLNIADRIADRWRRGSRERLAGNLATKLRSIAITDAMQFVQNAQRVACYGIGVWLAVLGSMTVGGVIAAAVLGRIGTASVRRAMAAWKQLHLTRQAYARISRRLGQRTGIKPATRDGKKPLALVIDKLTHRHEDSERPVFRNLSLTVAPGEILCILGASGSGKSTLARLIAGAIPPTRGSIRLGELDIGRYELRERKRLIGYQEQVVTLFTASIEENITSLTANRSEAAIQAAKLASVHKFIMSLPNGYETVVDGSEQTLAVGERKRLGLARAFFGRPRLIVLDEPEANLDARTIERLKQSILTMRDHGAVIVVVSQSDDFVTLSDKIVRLSRTARARIFGSPEAYEEYRITRSAARADGAAAAAPG